MKRTACILLGFFVTVILPMTFFLTASAAGVHALQAGAVFPTPAIVATPMTKRLERVEIMDKDHLSTGGQPEVIRAAVLLWKANHPNRRIEEVRVEKIVILIEHDPSQGGTN